MASLFFVQLRTPESDNFSYVVGDIEEGQAAVVDPPYEYKRVLDLAASRNLKIIYIINTHAHYDHTQGNERLKKATGARIVAYENSIVRKDVAVKEGDIIKLGGINIRVIHTPGHSPDGISLLVENKIVMTGDTLFVGECGRADLPGSDPRKLYDSLSKLTKLPDSVEVYPGHDYGPKPHSTIGYEKKNNYTLKPRTKQQFVKFMEEP
ncbi:MAG: MBL fold metallo-hydrolase [Promethearchaeati archaeon SRVP18_Atabeyarchaeia-1]